MTFESSVFFAVFYSANFGKDSDSWQLKSRESYFKWKLSHVILCAVLFYQYEENEKKNEKCYVAILISRVAYLHNIC